MKTNAVVARRLNAISAFVRPLLAQNAKLDGLEHILALDEGEEGSEEEEAKKKEASDRKARDEAEAEKAKEKEASDKKMRDEAEAKEKEAKDAAEKEEKAAEDRKMRDEKRMNDRKMRDEKRMEDRKAFDARSDALPEFLKKKLGAEDYGKACDMMDAMWKVHDDDLEAERKAEDEEREREADDGEAPANINKDPQNLQDRKRAHDSMAMDAAQVKAAIEKGRIEERRLQQAIYEARAFVRPWVGELSTIAFDSAESVYERALNARGVQTRGIHSSAYRALLQAQPKPGADKAKPTTTFATDSSAMSTAKQYAPGVERIRIGA